MISLALGAQDVPVTKQRPAPKFAFRTLGKPFMVFCLIVGIFTLGNSADAFLVLRAQERGLSILGVLGMLITFNLIYTLIATPAGSLSDRIGRRKLIIGGWLAYAVIYLGFGLAQTGVQIWALYALYGVYYGMAYGTANAMVADLVPAEVRGTAYGTYNASSASLHSRFGDRRGALAGDGGLAWLRRIGAVPVRRHVGAAGRCAHGVVAAAGDRGASIELRCPP